MPIRRLASLLDLPLPELPRDAEVELDYELRQQASVSVLMRAADPIDLLFIKRASNPGDPWSGHMALPGGRREPADADLLATAIRETREETGIELHAGQLIGRLPIVAPKGPRLPTIAVVPFVFAIDAETSIRREPAEVERTRWVALDHLRDPGALGRYEVPLPTGLREFPAWHLDDEDVIWGMTYRVIQDLLIALGR